MNSSTPAKTVCGKQWKASDLGLKLVPGAMSSSHPSVGGAFLKVSGPAPAGLKLPAQAQCWTVYSSCSLSCIEWLH